MHVQKLESWSMQIAFLLYMWHWYDVCLILDGKIANSSVHAEKKVCLIHEMQTGRGTRASL